MPQAVESEIASRTAQSAVTLAVVRDPRWSERLMTPVCIGTRTDGGRHSHCRRRCSPWPAAAHVTAAPLAQPEIVYAQPFGDGADCIGFESFADVVGRHQDSVSQRFAASLREWATVRA